MLVKSAQEQVSRERTCNSVKLKLGRLSSDHQYKDSAKNNKIYSTCCIDKAVAAKHMTGFQFLVQFNSCTRF